MITKVDDVSRQMTVLQIALCTSGGTLWQRRWRSGTFEA